NRKISRDLAFRCQEHKPCRMAELITAFVVLPAKTGVAGQAGYGFIFSSQKKERMLCCGRGRVRIVLGVNRKLSGSDFWCFTWIYADRHNAIGEINPMNGLQQAGHDGRAQGRALIVAKDQDNRIRTKEIPQSPLLAILIRKLQLGWQLDTQILLELNRR